MENITKEELLKSFGENVLSEEDLEKISGGDGDVAACTAKCREEYAQHRSKVKFSTCLSAC